MSHEATDVRLIRIAEVQRLTGLGRSQIYALASKGKFVRPVKLSERCSAWPENEVRAWIEDRIAAGRTNDRVAA
jgi:prophage regulatory protein